MPSKEAHLKIAERNSNTILYLTEQQNDHSEWITVIAFYRALHLVEALFSQNPKIEHCHTHQAREQRLKTVKRYNHIYKHYRPLYSASPVARYLEDNRRNTFTTFSEYLSPERIISEIVGHRLLQIEKSVFKLLR